MIHCYSMYINKPEVKRLANGAVAKLPRLPFFLHFSDIQRLLILSNTPHQLISGALLERDFVLAGV
jgi:hypothetical protein